MRSMNVDIAVDLMGFTQGQRTRIFSRRSAPVQVNFIGYPGTMGAEYVDYIMADRFVIPHDRQRDYAERIVYLPDCFQPNDNRRTFAAAAARRADHGLPEQGVIWCCFNNTSKINETTFDVWMRLLRQTPHSVLWLYVDNAAAQRNLHREAEVRGVARDRIIMAPRLPYSQHLARLALADVFLDTTPFCGGALASDALWAGVPLLTCVGDAFAARMSGSLLQALGLPQLITSDLQSYETVALALQPRRTGGPNCGHTFASSEPRRRSSTRGAIAGIWRQLMRRCIGARCAISRPRISWSNRSGSGERAAPIAADLSDLRSVRCYRCGKVYKRW